MTYISKEEAITSLLELRKFVNFGDAWNIIQSAIDVIDSLDERQPEDRWTPVGERLPEDWQSVIASTVDDVCFAKFNGTGFYFDTGTTSEWQELRGVTHWMPLPPPPVSETSVSETNTHSNITQ